MTQIAAPPRWDVTLPTGDGGGGEIDIPVIPDLEYVQEGDMVTHIAAPPRWDVTLPMGGGGGFAGISKEWPYTSILCFDQGAYHDFLSFFWGGGVGRDGGQLHLGIPSSKLDPCP